MRKLLVIVGLMLAAGMTVAVAGMGPLPNPLPKESKAVEKDGLSLAVRLSKTEWRADEPLEFAIALKNVSDKQVALWNVDDYRSYHIVVQTRSDDRDAGWTPEWLPPEKTTVTADLKSQSLAPGQSLEVPVGLRGHRWKYAAKTKVPVKPRDRLDPGMWTLQVTRDFMAVPAAKGGQTAPYWQGRIASRELVFQVVAEAAAPATERPALHARRCAKPECRNAMLNEYLAICESCKHPNICNAVRLCLTCSTKLKQCEVCRAPLDGTSAAAPAAGAAEKIEPHKPHKYVSGKWQYDYHELKNWIGGGRNPSDWGGELTYDGQPLQPEVKRDCVRTPWGWLVWRNSGKSHHGAAWEVLDGEPTADRVLPDPVATRKEPAAPAAGAETRATVVAEATDPTTGISLAIPRPGTVEATQDGKRVWSVTVPNECTKIRIVGREVHVSPSDRTFDLQSGKLLNIGTQGRIISFQPAAPASPAATSGAAAAPVVPPPFVEPALEIRLKADDPKLHSKAMAGVLALQKDRRVDYSVSGKMLTQFWLDEKQVQDFLAALKAAGLPVEGKLDLDPVDDRAPAFQKILQMWVLCAASDRGRDVEAEREKQRLAAEAERIEREKRLAKLREMPTNAIPVSEVRKWPEYAAAAVIDPYAAKPRFTEAQQNSLRERLKAALVPYIGEVGAVGEPQPAPPETRVWPAWTPLAAFSFRGPAGTADVWSAVSGQLGAHLRISGRTPVEREALIEWVRGIMKTVWGGELESRPSQMNANRYTEKRDTGAVEVSRWWFWWYTNPTLGVNDRENLMHVLVCQETAMPQEPVQGNVGNDPATIRKMKEEEEKLAASRQAHGAALPAASGRVVLTTVTIACGTGPEQFARALAKQPAPLTERQAIARLACAIRNAAAGTELAEIAGKDGARVRKATRDGNLRGSNAWSLTVTIPFTMTSAERKREPYQAHEGVDVRLYSVHAYTGETMAQGHGHKTEEEFRQTHAPNRNVALAEVTAWPEYAAAQRDEEETVRKQRQEHETKAAKIKAAYDKWWPEAKAKAAKALAAVRPDQAALAETFYMDAGTLWYPKKRPYGEYAVLRADDPTLVETIRQYGYNVADPEKWGITVAWGLRKQGIQNEPAGRIHFSHGPDGLRLRSLNITVPRAASDPAGKDREAWRKFALEGFRKLWGREPAGELQPEPPERTEGYSGKADERRIRNPEQHRLVWMPMWKSVPLSEGLGAIFEVVPAEGVLSMSWSMADEAGAETRKVLASLDAYPLSHSEREAIAVVVKNMPVLAPDLPMEKAWVLPPAWSVASPKSMLSYAPYQLYTDEAALRALLPKDDSGGGAVLTPARQVTVDTGEKDPRLLIGQVDPVSGRVLQATQNRPWAQRPVE